MALKKNLPGRCCCPDVSISGDFYILRTVADVWHKVDAGAIVLSVPVPYTLGTKTGGNEMLPHATTASDALIVRDVRLPSTDIHKEVIQISNAGTLWEDDIDAWVIAGLDSGYERAGLGSPLSWAVSGDGIVIGWDEHETGGRTVRFYAAFYSRGSFTAKTLIREETVGGFTSITSTIKVAAENPDAVISLTIANETAGSGQSIDFELRRGAALIASHTTGPGASGSGLSLLRDTLMIVRGLPTFGDNRRYDAGTEYTGGSWPVTLGAPESMSHGFWRVTSSHTYDSEGAFNKSMTAGRLTPDNQLAEERAYDHFVTRTIVVQNFQVGELAYSTNGPQSPVNHTIPADPTYPVASSSDHFYVCAVDSFPVAKP